MPPKAVAAVDQFFLRFKFARSTIVLNIPDSTKTPLSDIKPLLLSAFSRLLATSEDEILSGSSSVELLKSVNEVDDFSLYRESGSGKWISVEEDKAVSKVGLTSGDIVGVGFCVDGKEQKPQIEEPSFKMEGED